MRNCVRVSKKEFGDNSMCKLEDSKVFIDDEDVKPLENIFEEVTVKEEYVRNVPRIHHTHLGVRKSKLKM
ncbi:hypothetical protein JTB14_009633 [Gonioctena quinquepunctata]|nr:hypothetical protein JTB14_009633 [Gonioctena quinquepunctata]